VDKPKLADCSPAEILKALKKLGGFTFERGSAKHMKVIHSKTGFPFIIPRHSVCDRNLVKDMADEFLIKKCGYTKEHIYRYLWC